jgi:hypothetical protein
MIVAALVVILTLTVVGGTYYAVTLPHDNNPGPEPTPTALPSASPQTSSSPTATSIVSITPSPSTTTSVGYRETDNDPRRNFDFDNRANGLRRRRLHNRKI